VDSAHRVPRAWGIAILLTPVRNSVRATKTLSIRHPHPPSHPLIGPPHFLSTTHRVAFFRPACRILCSHRLYHPRRQHPPTCRWTSTSQVPSPFIRQVARSNTQMAIASYIARHLLSAWVQVISGNLTEKNAKHFPVHYLPSEKLLRV
jgi:hypothetical protein